MNKPALLVATMAALGAAAATPAQTPPANGSPQRITAEQIVASNDLNKDGIVTREEATEAKKSLITIWNMYDLDRDGRLDVAEIRKATSDVGVGNALQKITGDASGHKSMVDPKEVISSNDQNGDGIVTREEAVKAGKALIGLWSTYDLNNDGKVDIAEVAKASGY